MNARNLLFSALLLASSSAPAAIWSTSEIQWQHGTLDAPGFAGGGDASTDIVTLQNATGWENVELFVFLDILDDDRRDGFNDSDLYGELYLAGGLGKAFGHEGGFGPWKDIGWVFGVNYADDAKVRKLLPGLRLYWDAPGFAFLHTDITAYIDESRGVGGGGAPEEGDSFMVDVSWARPFDIGSQSFSFEGHAEYIDSRRNEFGGKVASWVLAQPQLRWDAGKSWFDNAGHLFLGVELQYWRNKLGDPGTDETAVQALAVWRF